jgi:hypothetical protein
MEDGLVNLICIETFIHAISTTFNFVATSNSIRFLHWQSEFQWRPQAPSFKI